MERALAEKAAEGSPAWAGIDRFGRNIHISDARFPRVGGDRPRCWSPIG